MTAALAVSPTTPLKGVLATITGSGFANATTYVLTISDPNGGVSHPEVTSDGSGGFTYTWVPTAAGTLKVDARPKTEHTGGTTAAATLSATTNLR